MSGLENGAIRIYKEVAPSITAREYKEPRIILERLNGSNRQYLHRSFRQFSERHYRGVPDVSKLKNTI